MVKELSWRFYYCLEPFDMLIVKGYFETVLNTENVFEHFQKKEDRHS